jgi:hypothetical protein
MKKKQPRKRMLKKEFNAALDKLGLTIASQRTSSLLGISTRQCLRIASGEQPVSHPVELLLNMYLKHGIDP